MKVIPTKAPNLSHRGDSLLDQGKGGGRKTDTDKGKRKMWAEPTAAMVEGEKNPNQAQKRKNAAVQEWG